MQGIKDGLRCLHVAVVKGPATTPGRPTKTRDPALFASNAAQPPKPKRCHMFLVHSSSGTQMNWMSVHRRFAISSIIFCSEKSGWPLPRIHLPFVRPWGWICPETPMKPLSRPSEPRRSLQSTWPLQNKHTMHASIHVPTAACISAYTCIHMLHTCIYMYR